MQPHEEASSRIMVKKGRGWTRIDVRVKQRRGLYGGVSVGIFTLAPFLFFPLYFYLFLGYQFSSVGEVLLLLQIAILFLGCVATWFWMLFGRNVVVVWGDEVQRARVLPPFRFIMRDRLSTMSSVSFRLDPPRDGVDSDTGTVWVERAGKPLALFFNVDRKEGALLVEVLSRAMGLPGAKAS